MPEKHLTITKKFRTEFLAPPSWRKRFFKLVNACISARVLFTTAQAWPTHNTLATNLAPKCKNFLIWKSILGLIGVELFSSLQQKLLCKKIKNAGQK